MVEAGANEIPEAEILDALDIAHGEIRKLCELQRELAEKAGKEKMVVEAPQLDEGLLDQIKASHGAALDEATQVEDKLARQDAHRAVEEQVLEEYGAEDADAHQRGERGAPRRGPDGVRQAGEGDHPRAHRGAQEAPRRSRRGRDPRHRHRGRSGAAHARLGPVHPRPDAGAERGRPGHDARGDAPRHARPADGQVLLAPLQLPAVLGRGGRLHARAQAPRHRSRRAGRAGAGADDPRHREVPVHDPRGVRHPGVQRVVVDGVGVRLLAVADGRRRADRARRWPGSPWA